MGKFNGLCPKPHIVFSNDREMVVSLCRKAGHMQKSDFAKCPVRTAKTYVDKNGVKRSVGLKKEMRESQHLGWNLEFLDYWIRIMKSIFLLKLKPITWKDSVEFVADRILI